VLVLAGLAIGLAIVGMTLGFGILGLVAEVPSKLARAGGSRPDFGPQKSKQTHKNHS
jgi:hypothetical protein